MRPASTRQFLEVEELVSRQAVLTGSVEPALMPRLLEFAAMAPDAITYRIEFTRDAAGQPRMIGRVEGMLPLICQRCLGAIDWRLDTRFESLVVDDEHEETNAQDAVVCSGGRLALELIIEDELLLALPSAPAHAYGSCEVPLFHQAAPTQRSARRSNPFSTLRALRVEHGRRRSN